MYLDYFNNFLTREKWAEVNHLSPEYGDAVLSLGRYIYGADYRVNDNPEAIDPGAINPHR